MPSAEVFWSEACTNARGKPLQTLLDSAHSACGITVRLLALRPAQADAMPLELPPMLLLLFHMAATLSHLILRNQAAACCASALAGSVLFYRWYRIDADCKLRIWRMYGWFTGLVTCGSIFGAVTWLTYMQCLVNLYKSTELSESDKARWMGVTALGYRHYSPPIHSVPSLDYTRQAADCVYAVLHNSGVMRQLG